MIDPSTSVLSFVAWSVSFVVAVTAAVAAPLPVRVGQCTQTTVKQIEYRLEGNPNSGSAVSYDNGGYQVSYDIVPAIEHSRRGDQVQLCLVSIPARCPRGDVRGRVYHATNLRTRETWQAPDSEHACGGA